MFIAQAFVELSANDSVILDFWQSCPPLVSAPLYSDCAPKTPAPQAQDDAAAKKLWDLSAFMVGLA